ncbi:glucose/galactose MFS transporter [Brevundimonas lenta]|uniref:FHS family L-fucose permease-like MFS transporter n=1 Tax=Brevundimonas lenta TaxID=424796 RepID=A0A7W6JFE8_9CAUL|nr:glucose/galactose MFS transporter [Brevundimonas lenta]MBB4084149.1 FHS family L-fucose permease-like MFS transporter [Brevundimonas lenta]
MTDQQTAAQRTGAAFAYVTTLFFAWGFATSLIDPLIAAVKGVFELNYTEALLTQFAWFTAYGIVSLPAAAVLSKLGYAKSIVGALGVMVLGALIVPLSTIFDFYPGVLVALFVIAAGVTLLQVAANPLAASLGKPEGSHFRLVFSQAFNSLGTVVGPLLGATVMLSGGIFAVGGVSALASPTALLLILLGVGIGAVAGLLIGALRRDLKGWLVIGLAAGLVVGWVVFLQNYLGAMGAGTGATAVAEAAAAAPDATAREATLRNIDTIFIGLAVFFAVLGAFIWSVRGKLTAASANANAETPGSPLKALGSKWAIFGAIAIFVYVGSEVTIGSLMTNLLHSEGTLGLPIHDAGRLVALYWAGALMGRFAGSAFLTRVPASILLAICTTCAAVLCLVVTQTGGVSAAFAALSVGLFNSIMFPAIFTLTLERSSAPASATSGLLCMAIIGGAILPLVGGRVADAGSLNAAFIIPALGYVILTIFAIAAVRSKAVASDVVAAPASH